jgi:hypothetical protein
MVDWYNNHRLFEVIGDIDHQPRPRPTTTSQPRRQRPWKCPNPASTEPGLFKLRERLEELESDPESRGTS